MGFELEVDNYRALRRVRWKADGVCALVGPNGSGKTTLLSVLPFLRAASTEGFGEFVEFRGASAIAWAPLTVTLTGMLVPCEPTTVITAMFLSL